MFTGCHAALKPGGFMVVTSRPFTEQRQLVDFLALVTRAGRAASAPQRRRVNLLGRVEQCYFGSISLGIKPDSTRNRPKVSGATQREVRAKLKELEEDFATVSTWVTSTPSSKPAATSSRTGSAD